MNAIRYYTTNENSFTNRRTKWLVGVRLHHAKFGYGTITTIEAYSHRIYRWVIQVDPYVRPKDILTGVAKGRESSATPGDRNGWHLVNSKKATTCEKCRNGEN